MRASPHPNQARAACERCRQLKIRCLRQAGAEASCTRCTRLSLHCQAGSQRKLGRPPKKDLAKDRQNEQPQTPGVDAEGEQGDIDCQFLDELAKRTVNVDWPTSGISPFESHNYGEMTLPMDHLLLAQDLEPLSHTETSFDVHFETLSKINIELYSLCNSIFRYASDADFETFACLIVGDFQGMKAFKIIMQAAQDYLVVIKALHMMTGTQITTSETPSEAPSTCSSEQKMTGLSRAPAALLACPLPGLSESPTSQPGLDRPSITPQILDSPVAFLVISCYVQLIRPLELVVTIMKAYIADTTLDIHPPAHDIFFAGAAIVDFSTQALLAIELIQHTLGQIQLVLGLPSPWSLKSIWSGLLSTQKYREMLNEELGEVEGSWTTRPAKLMELISATKDVLLERSMAGDW
ncbi:Fc.00g097990.m01.CDS01 [Cosmosporella sp. VM-42]